MIDFVEVGLVIRRSDHLVCYIPGLSVSLANSMLSLYESRLVRSLIFYCSGRDWIGSRTLLSLVGAFLVITASPAAA